MTDFLPEDGVGCHETGFTKTCRECVVTHRCRKWRQIIGTNPNTGEMINKWDCADSWMPLLTIENSQMQRQTGAAVESFRNEVMGRAAEAPQLAPVEAPKQLNG